MSTSTGTPAAERTWRVGERASFDAVIDDALIERFAELSGDRNPLHVDDDYASRTAFGGRIAHGMIAGALFSRLVGEHLPGENALYRSQELRFLAPLRPGAEVTIEGEVVAVDESLRLLTLATRVVGRNGDPLYVEGTAEVLLREPPARTAADPGELPAAAASGPALLRGKRAWIIGGSRGIGAAISQSFAEQGAASIAIGYHADERTAREVAESARARGCRATPVALDIRNEQSIQAAAASVMKEFGGIDVLVFSAHGAIDNRSLERTSYARLEDAFRRSAGGFLHAAQAVLPAMKRQRAGSIIAISSVVTLEPPPPAWLSYTVAKSALTGLARSLACELGPYGIRVNLVSPSLTETESSMIPPRVRDELAARAPLGKLARAEDVAASVAFLASDYAAFLTGVNLPVAGGSVL